MAGPYSSFQSDPSNHVSQKDLMEMFQKNSEIAQQANYAQGSQKQKQQGESQLEAQKGQQSEDQAKLKNMLERKQQADSVQTAQDYMDQNAQKGRKVGVTLSGTGGVSLQQNEPNMLIQSSRMAAQQGDKFNKLAGAQFKPINDQLNSAQSTLDALNQGNSSSDKLALINEAKLVLGAGGSRAIKQVMDSLSGNKTAAMNFQDTLNYFNNTPNIPTMQPAQRDAIREAVYNRLPQLKTQAEQISAQLMQQGPSIAPNADYGNIVDSYVKPATVNYQKLDQMNQQYRQQRTGQGNQVSNPATSNANPTTVDRLKSMFGMGGQSQPQQAQPQAPQQQSQPTQTQPVDPIAAEMQRRGLAQ